MCFSNSVSDQLLECNLMGKKMDFMLVNYFFRTVSGMTGKHFSVLLICVF